MRAAVLHGVGAPITIDDVVVDAPGTGEVLVRIAAAGCCHSDLHHIEGKIPHPLPMVVGHESSGVVEAIGDGVRDIAVGDHVVTCLSVFCGACDECLSGRAYRCARGDTTARARTAPRLRARDGGAVHPFYGLGGIAEQVLVSEHAVVRVDPDLPLDVAALLGCGAMTGLGAALRTAQVAPGDRVCVIGLGGVGLAALLGAKLAGAAQIVAVDRVAAKLDLAAKLGATDTVVAGDDARATASAVRDATRGGVDHAFEAIGNPATVRLALDVLARRGTATVIGLIGGRDTVTITGGDLVAEKRLQASLMGAGSFRVDVPRYLDLYRRGRLDLDGLITARVPIESVNDAYAAMARGDGARTVIVF